MIVQGGFGNPMIPEAALFYAKAPAVRPG